MKRSAIIFVIIGALIGGIAYSVYTKSSLIKDAQKTVPNILATPIPAEKEDYPVSNGAEHINHDPLPSLDQSDLPFEDQLFALFGQNVIEVGFNQKDLIRKIVVTVMNAQEASWPIENLPFKPVHGNFKTTRNGQAIVIDVERNESRYAPYLKLALNSNLKKVVALYAQYYSLFQSAYREVESKGEFNDLLVNVIDHLLNTPSPKTPIPLVKLNSSYQYLDSDLKALSVSQKALIRLGPDNEQKLKEKFRELRQLLTDLNK